jgi:hypothetical protein
MLDLPEVEDKLPSLFVCPRHCKATKFVLENEKLRTGCFADTLSSQVKPSTTW